MKADDDLAFAINQAIGDLQNIVKDLPQGATTEEQVQTIKKVDTVVYTLISSVDEVDRKLHQEEPFNFIGAVSRFFERGTMK